MSGNNGKETMRRVRMGWTGFTEVEGGYKSDREYHFLEFITTEDSCYVSKTNENIGNPLTDHTHWVCIASGKAATEAAQRCLTLINTLSGIKDAAIRATESANAATAGARQAESDAADAASIADMSAAAARLAATAAEEKASEMDAVISALAAGLPLTPVRMVVNAPEYISTKSKLNHRIAVTLYPTYTTQNVLFQRVNGESLAVDPSGNLTLTGIGETIFWVIPTQNTELWKQVTVNVRTPLIRLTSGGKMRLSNGKMRIV